jgi:hypothetical protein
MLEQAVRDALAVKPAAPEDGAVAALALEYARLSDEAAPAGKYEAALTWLSGQGADDRDADKHIRTISQALAAHSVASDLGPKLLAALESLEMSPRARGAAKKGTADDKPSANPLDELAARRAGLGNPAPVDATAT